MASPTKDERFATAGNHNLDPTGLLSTFVSVEVFKGTDMVDLYRLRYPCRPAVLTDLGQESSFEVRSIIPRWSVQVVFDGCFHIPFQGDGSPGRYQWLLSLSVYRRLQDFVLLAIYIRLGFIPLVDSCHRRFVFVR